MVAKGNLELPSCAISVEWWLEEIASRDRKGKSKKKPLRLF
jgi:hypothetical protein